MVGRLPTGIDTNNTSSLLDLLTTEPITNYCNAATDLNNILEDIAKRANDDGAAAKKEDCERMLPGKIRRLRNATRDVRNHLTRLDSMSATVNTTTNDQYSLYASDIQEHAERTRRALASIVQGSAGCRFHSNGIPRQRSELSESVNINLIAISTVKASIARIKEKIKQSY
jgi:hypothetical protein